MTEQDSSFKILEKNIENNYLKVEVDNVHVSVMNGIRRGIICYVECVTVDPKSIEVSKNTGVLHDQFLSDRLSYIPLNVSPDNYRDYRIEIHESKDSFLPFRNTESHPIYIYTDDLKVYKNNVLTDEKIFVGNSKLLYLKPNQEIKFKMNLCFYSNKEGRKYNTNRLGSVWNPVSQICYRYKTQADLLGREPIISEESDYLGKENNEPYEYIMQIQTLGNVYIDPQYVVDRVFMVLKNKCANLLKETTNHESSSVIRINEESKNRVVIQIFNGEEHTLGHMIQNKMDDVQRSYGESRENLVSYKMPHQLTDELHFIIQNDPKKIKVSPLKIFEEAIIKLMEDLDVYRTKWNNLDFTDEKKKEPSI
jgi:DNA-directed RNA polymerase subunit L